MFKSEFKAVALFVLNIFAGDMNNYFRCRSFFATETSQVVEIPHKIEKHPRFS